MNEPHQQLQPALLAAQLDFEFLAQSIQTIHLVQSSQVAKAVNLSVTFRNWLIGHYIAVYELDGLDRASYGEKVLEKLAIRLTELGVSVCDKRSHKTRRNGTV